MNLEEAKDMITWVNIKAGVAEEDIDGLLDDAAISIHDDSHVLCTTDYVTCLYVKDTEGNWSIKYNNG